ncbi:predicted protein [Uncinocarpus reesii 1704]|uniref:Phosphoribosylaminoimidazole-succinocarboxamide synthase n=1 Tax=Uncinocarpus reesii (strain UAMH 1704) TaxID=336963 RepID=C4JXU8_UNCRE|nr:uncharacterized protein UREG_07886 [Uncinocarpus reesii 1704]EEP83021.1 predicted protein [Uncinocarpus reesii 1704]
MDPGNRPQLVHTPSQQSIAASSDYYSLSNVTVSSERSKITVVRYQTPPSRPASPSETMLRDDSTGQVKEPSNSHRNPSQTGARTDTGTPSAILDDTPYIRFAIDQLTRDEELRGQGRQGTIVATDDYPVERIIPGEGLGYYSPVRKQDEEQQLQPETVVGEDHPELFIPLDPPRDGYRYPPLNAVPLVLRPLLLGPLIVLCVCMVAALIFCGTWSQKYLGLWEYDGFDGPKYFVFRFLPPLLAVSIILWVNVVQAAIYRVSPFSVLSRTTNRRRALQGLPMVPQNFLLPDMSHFQHGEALIGRLPLYYLGYELDHYSRSRAVFSYRSGTLLPRKGRFEWTTVRPVAWGPCFVLLAACCRFGCSSRSVQFGTYRLQWDPVCLADIIPLIQKSNLLDDFDQTEIADKVRDRLPSRPIRLGYWKTSTQPEIFYALGEANGPVKRLAEQTDRLKEKPNDRGTASEEVDVERQQLNLKSSFERNLHSPFVRFRWAPWFLKDTFIVAWIVIALVLFVGFIVVSFVKKPIRNGFLPLLPTLPSPSGFSPSNFLYSFIPALIGTLLFLAWQPLDVYFRTIQPFASLSSPDGTSADSSLLLKYNSCLPFEVTILALTNRHYKVAYISLVSLISLTLPVLAGGMFMARWYAAESEIRISTHQPAFYTLIAFVAVYALSFFALWPRRKRYLPHSVSTYADVISFLYQSPLLSDKIFREPKSKTDLVTRAIIAPPGEGLQALYAFGIYHGLDGKEHLGIDRLRRPERGDMLVSPPPGGRPFSI